MHSFLVKSTKGLVCKIVSVSKTGAALVQDVDRLKRDAARVVQDAREHANAHVAATREFVGQAVESVQSRVMSNPLYILGFGFALGLWIGVRLAGRAASKE